MGTENLRSEAKEVLAWYDSFTRGQVSCGGEIASVARHVLAEMDETLADEEFFRSIGVIVGATHPDSGATTFPVRSGPHWTGAIVHNGRTVLMVDVSPSGTTIHNPTRGQVLTALRLFGIPVKRSEK